MKENPKVFPEALSSVVGHFLSGSLKPPKFRKFQLDQYRKGIAHAMKSYTDDKAIIKFD